MGAEHWENHHRLIASCYAESTASLSHHFPLSLFILSGIYNLCDFENEGERFSTTVGTV